MNKSSPFNLANHDAYASWRDKKLKDYPEKAEDLIVEIANPRKLTDAEKRAIMARCRKANMVVYVSGTGDDPDKSIPLDLAGQFGLHKLDRNMGADDDGVTALKVCQDQQWRKRYIPYTNQAIHWHTDGYYNPKYQQIAALNLHCVRSAMEGGENALMDHEIAYLQLRDKNPEYIEALMHPDAMVIPENVVNDHSIRPARGGPVFSVQENGQLHMRYTARAHNVIWREDDATKEAVTALEGLLASESNYIYRLTLKPGWGLISSNVLHDRSEFYDSGDNEKTRLLYRLRYYDCLMLDEENRPL